MNRSDRNLIKKLLGDKYDPKKKYGFKGTHYSLRCRGYKFTVGKIHRNKGNVVACANGFHYCKDLNEVDLYYRFGTSRLFIVEDVGEDRHKGLNKIATSAIKLVKEIPYSTIKSRLKNYDIQVFNYSETKIFDKRLFIGQYGGTYFMNSGARILLKEEGFQTQVLGKGMYYWNLVDGFIKVKNLKI